MALALVAVDQLSDDEPCEGPCSGFEGSLAAIDSLSDQEVASADGRSNACQVVPAQPPSKAAANLKRKTQPSSVVAASVLRQKLYQTICSKCPCTSHAKFRYDVNSCYRQFMSELDNLVQLRLRLAKLDKQDADDEVRISVFQPGNTWKM